jgi:uncharacterized protein YgiM (DUF1202 family)
VRNTSYAGAENISSGEKRILLTVRTKGGMTYGLYPRIDDFTVKASDGTTFQASLPENFSFNVPTSPTTHRFPTSCFVITVVSGLAVAIFGITTMFCARKFASLVGYSSKENTIHNSQLYVSIPVLNVRDAASKEGNILSRLNCGDQVTTNVNSHSDWAEITMSGSDRPAYVIRKSLSATQPKCAAK